MSALARWSRVPRRLLARRLVARHCSGGCGHGMRTFLYVRLRTMCLGHFGPVRDLEGWRLRGWCVQRMLHRGLQQGLTGRLRGLNPLRRRLQQAGWFVLLAVCRGLRFVRARGRPAAPLLCTHLPFMRGRRRSAGIGTGCHSQTAAPRVTRRLHVLRGLLRNVVRRWLVRLGRPWRPLRLACKTRVVPWGGSVQQAS